KHAARLLLSALLEKGSPRSEPSWGKLVLDSLVPPSLFVSPRRFFAPFSRAIFILSAENFLYY
ncbi:MAG: hypothetical protein KC643_19300, partial [Nitrospira sp.]|nr:hypothetical protein [Nitrospira sp.]MCA9480244.1 hypothetical protein [Nitrospira sp.]